MDATVVVRDCHKCDYETECHNNPNGSPEEESIKENKNDDM
jgi:hypothetical protein